MENAKVELMFNSIINNEDCLFLNSDFSSEQVNHIMALLAEKLTKHSISFSLVGGEIPYYEKVILLNNLSYHTFKVFKFKYTHSIFLGFVQ